MGDRQLSVASSEEIAEDVRLVTLTDPMGGPLPAWEPGAHIDLVVDDLVRQYSLCGDPAVTRSWTIAVLRDEQGRGGSRLVHGLAAGDAVAVRGPRNHFPLVGASAYRFVAGGIGITPILPMIRAAEAAGTPWTLTYGGRRRASMAFLHELARFGHRVTVVPHDEEGLIDLDAALGAPTPGTRVYCCGPESLLAAVEEKCAGWPSDTLHVERFAPREIADPDPGLDVFEVEFQATGTRTVVTRGGTILEAATAAGIEVLTSCEEGTCGTCETVVLAGEPEHLDSVLSPQEQAEGNTMMICVSRSRTPVLVLDL